MKTNKVLIAALFTVLFWGCEKVEKLENFPLESPKITLNCNLEVNQDITVEITRSLSVIDGANLKEIADAEVKVSFTKDGKYISYTQKGTNDIANNVEVYTFDLKPELGITYKIEASAKKYTSVWSEATLPLPVAIDSVVQTIVDSSFLDFGGGYAYFNINEASSSIYFKDNANEENYYVLNHKVLVNSVNGNGEHGVYISSTIPGAEIINNLIFFTDQTFNGKDYLIQYDWESSGNLQDAKSDKVISEYNLVSLTKDYYRYLVSYNSYLQNKDNPFADPVQVYNNIFGGYGIFAGSSSSSISKLIK